MVRQKILACKFRNCRLSTKFLFYGIWKYSSRWHKITSDCFPIHKLQVTVTLRYRPVSKAQKLPREEKRKLRLRVGGFGCRILDSMETGRDDMKAMEVDKASFGNDVSINTMVYPPLPVMPSIGWDAMDRKKCQEVVPGIFLGPNSAAAPESLSTMLAMGLTHVVSIQKRSDPDTSGPHHGNQFSYLVIDLDDGAPGGINILPHLSVVNNFIEACMESGGRVLIHSEDSTNAAFLIGYLMFQYGIEAGRAHTIILCKRFLGTRGVNPMLDYLQQLKAYEPIFLTRKSVSLYQAQSETPKRSFDDVEEDDEEMWEPVMDF